MKHLLNDLSSEEKNRILEQYDNSFIVETSKFNKLMESKLGDVKPLVEFDLEHLWSQIERERHTSINRPEQTNITSGKEKFDGKVQELFKYMADSGMEETEIYNELTKMVQDKLNDLVSKSI